MYPNGYQNFVRPPQFLCWYLLMVQKSHNNHRLDVKKNPVNNGKKKLSKPQLVSVLPGLHFPSKAFNYLWSLEDSWVQKTAPHLGIGTYPIIPGDPGMARSAKLTGENRKIQTAPEWLRHLTWAWRRASSPPGPPRLRGRKPWFLQTACMLKGVAKRLDINVL